jgi:hypothetical protein
MGVGRVSKPTRPLKDCKHCGMTPALCENKQHVEVQLREMSAGRSLTTEQKARAMRLSECCPNCQHIT